MGFEVVVYYLTIHGLLDATAAGQEDLTPQDTMRDGVALYVYGGNSFVGLCSKAT